jgi:hypothetical protein
LNCLNLRDVATNCIPGPSKDEMQLQLMNDESANAGTKGGATSFSPNI